jgi:RimJ/RimL family protein N-acetyltransferase
MKMRRHRADQSQEKPGPRQLELPELTTSAVTVRELRLDDADHLLEAASVADWVRGSIPLPASGSEAVAMLEEYERLRQTDEANLFGVLDSNDGSLCGVITLRVSDGDSAAEGACWNRSDPASRKVMAAGIDLLTAHAHQDLNIIRLWVVVEAVDPFAKHLAAASGWSRESSLADGKLRLSSIG